MHNKVNIPDGHWLCWWHFIYGNVNHAEAFRPDSEEPVITADGEKICQKCADTYWTARKDAVKPGRNGEL